MLPYVFRGAAFAAARASAAHTRALSAGPPPPDWPQLMQAAITPSVAEELADKVCMAARRRGRLVGKQNPALAFLCRVAAWLMDLAQALSFPSPCRPAPTPRAHPQGYAVVDGALPPPTVAAAPLRSGDGLVRPNCTHLVRQGSPQPELLPKAHVSVAILHNADHETPIAYILGNRYRNS